MAAIMIAPQPSNVSDHASLEERKETLGPAISNALEKKGYKTLTTVQTAVLDPAIANRDLRITSQTGSGKTVAVGFALREIIKGDCAARGAIARPLALVVAPTRELAKQFEEELTWLYKDVPARVAAVTGGASYRDERRALAAGPAVVVGTPGRLLDHLERGGIEGSQLGAVVLDEADRLLDMGFRDDLEKILSHAPEGHRTHLVSATFPREVKSLADRVQDHPAHVEGTRLGQANVDIDHVIHLVTPFDRVNAVVNLLLANEGEQTLVFARTRADVARIAGELEDAGFRVSALSGEMEQRARNRALEGFKSGDLDALVATDVAARGIDVQDIARVIHVEAPADPDTYTHRSGRTGRAGKKGVSAVLVPPSALVPVLRLLSRAGVKHRFEPVPSASSIRRAHDERIESVLTADDPEGFPGFDERLWDLAKRLATGPMAARTIARLITRVDQANKRQPRDVRPIEPPLQRTDRNGRFDSPPRDGDRFDRGPRRFDRDDRPQRPFDRPQRGDRPVAPRAPMNDGPREQTAPRNFEPRESNGESEAPRPRAPRPSNEGRSWVEFRVTWGEVHGADTRRMLPLLCRRGDIQGSDVGAIKLGKTWSTVEIASDKAEAFAVNAARPDPRDARILIQAVSTTEPRMIPREATPREEPKRVTPPRDRPSTPRVREEAPRAQEAPVPRAPRSTKNLPDTRNEKPFTPRSRDDGPPRGRDQGPPRSRDNRPPRGRDQGPPRGPRSSKNLPPNRGDKPFAPRPRVDKPLAGGAPPKRRIVTDAQPMNRPKPKGAPDFKPRKK